MTNVEVLTKEIAQLEAQLKEKHAALREIWDERDRGFRDRIKKAHQGEGDFTLEELRFSASYRCDCGAGFAYPHEYMNVMGDWHCSAILMGTADRNTPHTRPLPFPYYEIKSEDQPTARGATTRPGATQPGTGRTGG